MRVLTHLTVKPQSITVLCELQTGYYFCSSHAGGAGVRLGVLERIHHKELRVPVEAASLPFQWGSPSSSGITYVETARRRITMAWTGSPAFHMWRYLAAFQGTKLSQGARTCGSGDGRRHWGLGTGPLIIGERRSARK